MATTAAAASTLTRRKQQRSSQPEQQQQPSAAAADAGPPPTLGDYARFAALQHGGLALCVFGVALLICGYDAGWMHSTTLSLICLGFCLLGLFMHETRPVSVSCLPLSPSSGSGLFDDVCTAGAGSQTRRARPFLLLLTNDTNTTPHHHQTRRGRRCSSRRSATTPRRGRRHATLGRRARLLRLLRRRQRTISGAGPCVCLTPAGRRACVSLPDRLLAFLDCFERPFLAKISSVDD
jgi:hypothetical protein